MSAEKVRQFLDSHQTKYLILTHSPAYTAQEIAQAAHIPGKEMVKAVMARLDGKLVMLVMPSTHAVSFQRVEQATGAHKAELASEPSFEPIFADCEVGAMPPFGNLYDLDVYMADALAGNQDIAFNAGSHSQLIRMACQDYIALVKPKIVKLTV
jgi:Ala-tRNA(Pro) deacylase